MKAGKRFELVMVPGQRHGFGELTEYTFWKLADHFNKYLIGDDRASGEVNILEMDREIERKR
jgi:hypothetical protein